MYIDQHMDTHRTVTGKPLKTIAGCQTCMNFDPSRQNPAGTTVLNHILGEFITNFIKQDLDLTKLLCEMSEEKVLRSK